MMGDLYQVELMEGLGDSKGVLKGVTEEHKDLQQGVPGERKGVQQVVPGEHKGGQQEALGEHRGVQRGEPHKEHLTMELQSCLEPHLHLEPPHIAHWECLEGSRP